MELQLKVGKKHQNPGQLLMKNLPSKTVPESINHPENKVNSKKTVNGQSTRPREVGGPKGPEPTRYGDWEKGGRCSDF